MIGQGRTDRTTFRGYQIYMVAIFLNSLAIQIQTVAIGWQVYEQTQNPFDLGLVGLSQFAPALMLFLVTGAVADRFPRRFIMSICMLIEGMVALGILAMTLLGYRSVGLVLVLMAVFGAARAFYIPARQSLLPNLVPPTRLPSALALNSSVNQFATIFGPVAGGLIYSLAPYSAYGTTFALLVLGSALMLFIPKPPQRSRGNARSWEEITAGIRYIWNTKIVLGAISLDLFVVLLGGAYALLPIYASDVLDIGSLGLGILRSAPACGALLVGLWLIRFPIGAGMGRILFITITIFALGTLIFSLSTSLLISIIALFFVGASDMVSVIIRNTLVQTNTHDDVRGRVNAVGQVFTGASNELGGFRAGTMASFIGPVASVAFGAVMSLVVCFSWMRLFPDLLTVDGAGGKKANSADEKR